MQDLKKKNPEISKVHPTPTPTPTPFFSLFFSSKESRASKVSPMFPQLSKFFPLLSIQSYARFPSFKNPELSKYPSF